VALTVVGPLRVLAGAGTGKTRAITHRIAYGVATGHLTPTEVLAVTFTTRAAGELRQRLAGLGAPGVQARTFHSAALRQLRYFWPQVSGHDLPRLVESKLGLVGAAVSHHRLTATQPELRDLAGEIEWAKVSNVGPASYAAVAGRSARRVEGFDHETVARVYDAYEEVKQARAVIDLEDILLLTAGMLAEHESVAAAVRRQYQCFVVDEFQDVSPIQSALLDLWLGGRDQVCVVGDPAQTIYSFAGASESHLLDFPKKFPGTRSVALTRNYRSTPQVVTAANTVMAARVGRSAVALRATREEGPAVGLQGHPDEVDEAAGIATEIATAVSAGASPADFAVLFRINAQSQNFEEALAERGVPFVVRGAERFFERPEVKQAVTLLRGAARAGEGSTDLVETVTAVLSGAGWSPQPPEGRGTVRDRWESLQALVSLTSDLAAADPTLDLTGLVAELQRRAALQHAPIAEGVTLATLHAAKGLEWPVVYLAGMHEGTMPFVYADTPGEIEEERRLLYVGVTRARDRLRISWAAARSPGGRGGRGPSRFLDGLVGPQHSTPAARGARGRAGRARRLVACRVCSRPLTEARERKLGRCVDCPSSYDEALYDALRDWRREQAAQEKVPAYCVFTDATLTALAELCPSDLAQLVRVPGIGQAKLDKYGDQILTVCAGEHQFSDAR